MEEYPESDTGFVAADGVQSERSHWLDARKQQYLRTSTRRGRGANGNPEGRFESTARSCVDDGWAEPEAGQVSTVPTRVATEHAKSIITRNSSPDVPFNYSINPYRGCEHGCTYCFARPGHGYLNLSPGLDFETRLIAKVNAAECLERELSRPRYHDKRRKRRG